MSHILPSCLTSCPHVSHPALMSHILPSCLTSCPHVSHPALMSHILPSCLTSCPHVSHPALMSHILPSCLTSCPHVSHPALMSHILPSCLIGHVMASPFKIPKKKQGSDSAPLFASPLSRLQSPAPFKGYGGPSRGSADRVHAGSSSANSEPLFTSVVKTLLGLNSTISGANHRGASANHRGGGSSQSEPSSAFGPNGMWRPKRASDRLLSPPQKKNGHLTGSSSESVSVEAPDSLAELRGDGHAGSWSSVRLREEEGDAFQSDTGSSLNRPISSRRRAPPPPAETTSCPCPEPRPL
ncbi:hypothetical protein NQZ68_039500 [Dissostichus eleginoides]|nr:hypothetical protein NQZ68_039500 [Dissostichus eleginoides]